MLSTSTVCRYKHVQRPIWITTETDDELTALMEDRPAWQGGSVSPSTCSFKQYIASTWRCIVEVFMAPFASLIVWLKQTGKFPHAAFC